MPGGKAEESVPDVLIVFYIELITDRYCCKRCRYKFDEFTGTYLGKLKIPLNTTAHMLYLFTLGVPAYRTRFYVPINLRTVERAFRLFREAIYDFSLEDLKELRKLSGRLEMDEALFGGHRKGKRGAIRNNWKTNKTRK
jgi:hypothetical protein